MWGQVEGIQAMVVQQGSAADRIRGLVAVAALSDRYGAADEQTARSIRSDLLELAFPLVFERHTRLLERDRGHRRCLISADLLTSTCYDRYVDDTLAVVDYTLRSCNQPVENIEGWIVSRMRSAVIDGYRRRRGDVGALQRPRLPQWLVTGLGEDTWLCDLALSILEWVGVPATAGEELWPVGTWSQTRAIARPDTAVGDQPAAVRRDIATVLTTMQKLRPDWYGRYVERPLGKKPVPVTSIDWAREQADVVMSNDSHEDPLVDAAESSLGHIRRRHAEGAPLAVAVHSGLHALATDPAVVQLKSSHRKRLAWLMSDLERQRHLSQLIESLLTAS